MIVLHPVALRPVLHTQLDHTGVEQTICLNSHEYIIPHTVLPRYMLLENHNQDRYKLR